MKVTTEGKQVFSGTQLFRLIDEQGIPLSIVLAGLCDRGLVPDWIEFYTQCREVGWKHSRIMSKLAEALGDSYPKEFNKVVLGRLEKYSTLEKGLSQDSHKV